MNAHPGRRGAAREQSAPTTQDPQGAGDREGVRRTCVVVTGPTLGSLLIMEQNPQVAPRTEHFHLNVWSAFAHPPRS